ncbi:MAG: thioredoxin family protein [Butyricicoccus sp.]
MAMIECTGGNYKELTSEGFVILDIYSDNCMFCEMLDEVLVQLSAEMPFLKIVRGNGTTYPEIDRENNVYAHPTMVFMKDGVELGRQLGFCPADMLRPIIAQYMY